jgi:PTS system galactitol-specific IIB component
MKGETDMKRIVIACGSGVATSTVANQKVSQYLNEHGYAGKYQIEQCQVSELAEKAIAKYKSEAKNADFAIATTVVGGNIPCPVIPGLPLLTGIGVDKLFSDVEEQMKK